MIANILRDTPGGCTAFLGGILRNTDSNLVLDEKSRISVIEADEYDRSFHRLHPWIAVVTSTDPDHLDIYDLTLSEAYILGVPVSLGASAVGGYAYSFRDTWVQFESRGARRRFEIWLDGTQKKGSAILIDDYANFKVTIFYQIQQIFSLAECFFGIFNFVEDNDRVGAARGGTPCVHRHRGGGYGRVAHERHRHQRTAGGTPQVSR